MKTLINKIFIILLLFFSGCASVPHEATSLSIEIGGLINSSRKTHMNLLDEYIKERRARADDYLHNIWIPNYLRSFVKKIDLEKEICGNIESYDSALVLRDFVEAASLQVIKKRLSLNKAIDEIERKLRKNIRSHYANLKRANSALTSNLKSYQENKDFRDEILKQLKMEPEKLPFEKLSEKLKKLMR